MVNRDGSHDQASNEADMVLHQGLCEKALRVDGGVAQSCATVLRTWRVDLLPGRPAARWLSITPPLPAQHPRLAGQWVAHL